MIIKGGARGGAGNLAAHLVKERNERVTVLAIEGLAATSIKDALNEIMAHTTGTECRDGMYHASVSPHPGEPNLTQAQKLRTAELLAERLGLAGQPYIMIEHQKIGDSGIERTHHHIVWSRVNEAGKTISDFKNYEAHERTSRQLEAEFGHAITPGPLTRDPGTPRSERTPDHYEWQQAERNGLSPKDAKALLSDLWSTSDSGNAFIAAAVEAGFIVCQGDRRDFVLVDRAGEVASLGRRVPGNAATVRERMSDVDREGLPTVEEARAHLKPKPEPPGAPTPLDGRASEQLVDRAEDPAQGTGKIDPVAPEEVAGVASAAGDTLNNEEQVQAQPKPKGFIEICRGFLQRLSMQAAQFISRALERARADVQAPGAPSVDVEATQGDQATGGGATEQEPEHNDAHAKEDWFRPDPELPAAPGWEEKVLRAERQAEELRQLIERSRAQASEPEGLHR